MRELKKRIIEEVENKAMLRGILGTKSVKVTLVLSDEEIKKLDKMDISEHYTWKLEGNKLYVSHVEEIAIKNDILQEIPVSKIRLKDTLVWNNEKTCEITKITASGTDDKIITYKYFDDGSKEYEKNSEKIGSERLVKIRRP